MKPFTTIAAAAVIGTSLVAATPLKPARAAESIRWDEQSRISEITCNGLGTFTLDTNQRPSSQDLPSLCGCLIQETNQKGWEIPTLNKLNAGQDVGFIEKNGAIARFGQAVNSCAADKYYLSDDNSTLRVTNQSEGINLVEQRLLGFLGGGPIGMLIAPWAYNLFGGNLVIWIIAGVIIGGFLWQFTIGLAMLVVGVIGQAFSSNKAND